MVLEPSGFRSATYIPILTKIRAFHNSCPVIAKKNVNKKGLHHLNRWCSPALLLVFFFKINQVAAWFAVFFITLCIF